MSSTRNFPSAQQLNDDPTLLLHRKPPATGIKQTITAYHSSLAAVIDGGRFFITTPYTELEMCNPVLVVEGMRMRKDFRFGLDDYIHWPQKWSRALCHLPCILKQPPRDHDHPLWLMWWIPTEEYFVPECGGITTSLGRLTYSRSMEIRKIAREIMERSDEFCLRHSNQSETSLVRKHSRTLSGRLARLEYVTVTFQQMCMTVVAVQRTCLELHALLEYCDVYKPRMDGSLPSAKSAAPVIGAFTWDLDDAALLFRAGIPFWFIRSRAELGAVAVSAIAPLSMHGSFSLEDPPWPSRTAFKGIPNLDAQYSAILTFAEEAFRTFSSFSTPIKNNNLLLSSPSLIGPERNVRTGNRRKQQSYSQAPPKRARAWEVRHIGQFSTNQYLPPFCTSWKWAYDRISCHQVSECRHGYAFPDPLLFVAVKTPAKMGTYCVNWLHLRALLIFRLTRPSPSFVTNDLWRQMLSGDFLETPTEEGQLETRASARRSDVRSLFDTFLSESEIDLDSNEPPTSVHWRERSFDVNADLPVDVVQEIIYELSILNFRCELTAIDDLLTPLHLNTDGHRSLLSFCLFGTQGGDVLAVDFQKPDHGFAAESPTDRSPYVFALRDVMYAWSSGSRAQRSLPSLAQTDNITGNAYLDFEKNVILAYLQAVFDCFGRCGVTPLRRNTRHI
ncbi:hypothetical protein K435DRAFT_784184 [Dendrothele bispora CBS 962.96]|uniref:Uncharacterized protein n=1 Tax=Dendrothele bispora (strain CBS 962.96) TaxID=1314807 RepID=A0A4S8L4H7_DENBC|nr:hypothetical protein K435DRAFT_784184 [Dendrothele bispora CBS 962.96]